MSLGTLTGQRLVSAGRAGETRPGVAQGGLAHVRLDPLRDMGRVRGDRDPQRAGAQALSSKGAEALHSGGAGQSRRTGQGAQGTAPRDLSGLHTAGGAPRRPPRRGQGWRGMPPPPWPPARGHRRQGGARTSHVLTKPAPAPAQLRGGNALSHSYERSSLLEGRSRTQNHTTPGLGAPAGVGRGASAAWGSTTGPAHPRGPTKDTERERTVGRAEAGDFSPSPCHGCTWWRTVLFPGLGNPSAPRWFWKQLPLQPPSRETLPIRGAESGPGHPHRPRVSNMTPSAPTTQALWHQSKQLLPLPVRG